MREKILRLFEVTNSTESFKNFVNMMLEQIRVVYGTEEPKLVNTVFNRVNAIVDAEVPQVTEELAKLYEETYSETDIDAMLKWHTSPVGQKVAAMTGPLQAGGFAIGAKVGAKVEEEIKKILREFELSNDAPVRHLN